jgi:hypothetical protein
VAEWLCSGLQSRVRRFDSDPRLQIPPQYLFDVGPQAAEYTYPLTTFPWNAPTVGDKLRVRNFNNQ